MAHNLGVQDLAPSSQEVVTGGTTKLPLGHKPLERAVFVEMMAAGQSNYIRAPMDWVMANWTWLRHA